MCDLLGWGRHGSLTTDLRGPDTNFTALRNMASNHPYLGLQPNAGIYNIRFGREGENYEGKVA
jgi:hypothetical protein